jgi:hypothetical protein
VANDAEKSLGISLFIALAWLGLRSGLHIRVAHEKWRYSAAFRDHVAVVSHRRYVGVPENRPKMAVG